MFYLLIIAFFIKSLNSQFYIKILEKNVINILKYAKVMFFLTIKGIIKII